MDWILIGIGAGMGSVMRYEIGKRMTFQRGSVKTAGTFTVNMTGAFFLGMAVALSLDGLWWSLLADGFLGGFTTFSTLMVEGVWLIRGNQKMNGLVYLTATAVLGVMAFFMGDAMAGRFFAL